MFIPILFALCWISVNSLAGVCSNDSDCADGTVCLEIDTGRTTFRKCTADSEEQPACRGRIAGRCPTQDSSLGPTMCLFVKTTQLRDITCCSDSDQADCFECFPDPAQSNKTIAGTYKCVLESQCVEYTAFEDACETGLTCDTQIGTHCSGSGTCSPTHPDDPIKSFECLCQAGFGGPFCEDVVSDACNVDCGRGSRGECVDEKCVCAEGWDGLQCEKCATDQVCNSENNGGTCDVETGQCVCNPGFEGDAQCSAEGGEACDRISCGANGQCLEGVCLCLNECAGSVCKECATPACTDCSTASFIQTFSWSTMVVLWLLYNF